MKSLTTLGLMLALMAQAHSTETVVLAQPKSNRVILGPALPECPPDHICPGRWVRWELYARNTLSGPQLKGRVVAATVQNSLVGMPKNHELWLFVLEPINNAEQRKALKADFYLKEFSEPHTMYCLEGYRGNLGAKESDIFELRGRSSYRCVEPSENK